LLEYSSSATDRHRTSLTDTDAVVRGMQQHTPESVCAQQPRNEATQAHDGAPQQQQQQQQQQHASHKDAAVSPEASAHAAHTDLLSPILQSLNVLQRVLSPYSTPVQLGRKAPAGSGQKVVSTHNDAGSNIGTPSEDRLRQPEDRLRQAREQQGLSVGSEVAAPRLDSVGQMQETGQKYAAVPGRVVDGSESESHRANECVGHGHHDDRIRTYHGDVAGRQTAAPQACTISDPPQSASAASQPPQYTRAPHVVHSVYSPPRVGTNALEGSTTAKTSEVIGMACSPGSRHFDSDSYATASSGYAGSVGGTPYSYTGRETPSTCAGRMQNSYSGNIRVYGRLSRGGSPDSYTTADSFVSIRTSPVSRYPDRDSEDEHSLIGTPIEYGRVHRPDSDLEHSQGTRGGERSSFMAVSAGREPQADDRLASDNHSGCVSGSCSLPNVSNMSLDEQEESGNGRLMKAALRATGDGAYTRSNGSSSTSSLTLSRGETDVSCTSRCASELLGDDDRTNVCAGGAGTSEVHMRRGLLSLSVLASDRIQNARHNSSPVSEGSACTSRGEVDMHAECAHGEYVSASNAHRHADASTHEPDSESAHVDRTHNGRSGARHDDGESAQGSGQKGQYSAFSERGKLAPDLAGEDWGKDTMSTPKASPVNVEEVGDTVSV
jgi:hypothetical protein